MLNLLNIIFLLYNIIYYIVLLKTFISTILIIYIIGLKYICNYQFSLKKIISKLLLIHLSHHIFYIFINNLNQRNYYNFLFIFQSILAHISIYNKVKIIRYYREITNENIIKSIIYYIIFINNNINDIEFNRAMFNYSYFNIKKIIKNIDKKIIAPAA